MNKFVPTSECPSTMKCIPGGPTLPPATETVVPTAGPANDCVDAGGFCLYAEYCPTGTHKDVPLSQKCPGADMCCLSNGTGSPTATPTTAGGSCTAMFGCRLKPDCQTEWGGTCALPGEVCCNVLKTPTARPTVPGATVVPTAPPATAVPTNPPNCTYGNCGADGCGTGKRWVSGSGCPSWYTGPGCYTDLAGCGTGSGEDAKFNGTITSWDGGMKRWMNGAVNCAGAKGVSLTTTSGVVQWYTDHFDVINNPQGQQQTVTLALPASCGYSCGTWNVIDRGTNLTGNTIVKTGTGCVATFTPQNTDWRTAVTWDISKTAATKYNRGTCNTGTGKYSCTASATGTYDTVALCEDSSGCDIATVTRYNKGTCNTVTGNYNCTAVTTGGEFATLAGCQGASGCDPTAAPTCSGLTLNGQSGNITVAVGATVTLASTVSNYGLISSAKVTSLTGRVADTTATNLVRYTAGTGNLTGKFVGTQVGIYAFEVNAYESSSCNYLCSAGATLYKSSVPNQCLTRDIWVGVGNCSSTGCIHYVTVTAPTTAKTCSISMTETLIELPAGEIAVTLTGKGNSPGTEDVRLSFEKEDGTLLASPPTGVGSSGCWDTCAYSVGKCSSTNGSTCTANFTISDIPAGRYYLHCDLPNNTTPTKCSGNPFCTFSGGTQDCSGWVSCSNNDNYGFTVEGVVATDKFARGTCNTGTGRYTCTASTTGTYTTLALCEDSSGCDIANSTDLVLKYRMAFAGLKPGARCAVDWTTNLIVKGGAQEKTYNGLVAVKTAEVNSNGDMIYKVEKGLTGFTQKTAVAAFIKGIKHLQMKYGKNDQTSSYGKVGGELILKTATETGHTVYDFSEYPMLAGDINQDGAINVTDFALVKAKASKYEKVDDDGYLAEDLDGNCLVNVADMVLLINSLDEKEGELY
ncbi:MAG: dockerin type I repeat-containing protein [Candidatus Shapirobacteria bacterium]